MRTTKFFSSLFALIYVAIAETQPQAIDHAHNITYRGANINGVESFQGIRFGQDTSGANRFKHPKAFSYATDRIVQATTAGASCPQNTVQTFLGITQDNGVTLSEDCLNLLVVRPRGTKQNANLPVMVWIYGGEAIL
jgi:carboxylesterase type B